MSINREGIVDRLLAGEGRPAEQFAPPIAVGRIADRAPIPFNLAQARTPLAKAGYPDGFRMTILLLGMDWVAGAEVRLREEGHIFMGEAFVVPRPGTDNITRLVADAAEASKRLNWRMHELRIMPVEQLPDAQGG